MRNLLLEISYNGKNYHGWQVQSNAVTVQEGSTVTVEAVTLPIEAPITWTSSDDTKATVANGVITGVASGSATITAVSGSASASVAVTVTA